MFKSVIVGILLLSACPVAWGQNEQNNEAAEDLGAAVGSVAGAPGGPEGAAAGALAGKYGTRFLNSKVRNSIDEYFDTQDQDFANKTGITIKYKDGKVIEPQQESHCAKGETCSMQ